MGNRVASRLKAVKKSQGWLADQVGMRQQGINSIIAGDVERPRKLREIAVALETTQEYLLGETNNPTLLPRDDEAFAGYARLSASQKQAVAALIVNLLGSRSAPRRSAGKRKAAPKRP